MYGIPQATSDYFTQVKQLKDQIPIELDRVARMKSDAARADANSNSYASGSPEFVAAQEAQWKKAANLKVDYEEAAANLKKMKDKLSELELDFLKYAGVFAYPTGKAYSGVPIWQFVEMAP